MARNLNPPTHKSLERSVWNKPSIGFEKTEEGYRKDCRMGSITLRELCLDLFQRTANRYCISMDDAMACHLGYHAKPVIPGTERPHRGQFAQRRLAA